MSAKTKCLALLIALPLFLFGAARLYFELTDDIRLSNMRHPMPHHPVWDSLRPNAEEHQQLREIFSQEFDYLGKGSQSYVFKARDEKYVLKFFKFKHLRPAWWHPALSLIPPLQGWGEKQEARKKRKLYGVFDGYKIAYDNHRLETGLVFVHLQPTDYLSQTVVIRDKLGFKRSIDLDQYVFVLQHHAKTTAQILSEALDQGDVAIAERRLDQLFDLYHSEYQKGLYDHDHGITHNTGFVGEQPIRLDVGKLCRNVSMRDDTVALADMELVLERLHPWIVSRYPDLFPVLSAHMEEKLNALYRGHGDVLFQ